jgi:hypothetical protein
MICDLRFAIVLRPRTNLEILSHKPQIVNDILVAPPFSGYIDRVKGLTKQEQLVLCVVLGLLLTGWAVKAWRTAHPPATATQQVKP